ncbi:MAG: septal ring lytic transglycosylase RlpA family protein [Stenotrophobium sp.]
MTRHPVRLLLLLVLAASLAACGSLPPLRTEGGGTRVVPEAKPTYPSGPANPLEQDRPPPPGEIPPNVANTPDAVPVPLPRSASGNAQTYEVLGKTYEVMDDAHGFHQRGYASWYGQKFHGHKTASGERYNMFAMTAAHKTLPLPTFVRVTNLANHKTAIVKVNDRGPFHSKRIIDLSYAAAAKLGIIGHGTSMVQIDTVEPASDTAPAPPPPPAATATASMTSPQVPAAKIPVPDARLLPGGGYLQVAAYLDPINARAMSEQLQNQGVAAVSIHTRDGDQPPVHRVLVGPFLNESAAHDVREQLSAQGLKTIWIGN